jgi:ribosomal protein S18 acetylase RimI-like enzyme
MSRLASAQTSLRRATIKDLQAIVLLGSRIATEHYKRNPSYWVSPQSLKKESIKFYRKALSKSNEYYLLAEDDGRAVGFFSMKIIKKKFMRRRSTYGHVSQAYVVPEMRRRGLTQKAMNHFRVILKRKRIKDMELLVDATNIHGYKAWKALGFVDLFIQMYRRV